MCGITGIIDLSGNNGSIAAHLKSMTDTLKHRGPDGEGYLMLENEQVFSSFGDDTPEDSKGMSMAYSPFLHINDCKDKTVSFGLGHRRLSIVDVSAAGHQPMCDAEKKLWIVHNGEIYNFPELREELKEIGFAFSSGTDTEVILAAYRAWGEDCVKRFEGMWAFALYDSENHTLFCSRDRVGVKPFYFYRDKSVFVFASEQKALVDLPFLKTGINQTAAASFLAGDLQYIERGEENMFRNIFELMPGRNLTINLKNHSFSEKVYRELPNINDELNPGSMEFEALRKETESKIMRSVKLHLRSDVPVGSCLSGGIDSSAIVGAMHSLVQSGEKVNLGGALKVFTLSFQGMDIDESSWARKVVDRTGSEWYQVTPDADELMQDLNQLNYAQDIPVCSTGTYGQFRLMKEAKERGVKVILDGQGGDELFAGYPAHAIVYWKQLFRNLSLGILIKELRLGAGWGTATKWIAKDQARFVFDSFLPTGLKNIILNNYSKPFQFLNPQLIKEYFTSGASQEETALSREPSLNNALLHDFYDTRLKMYLKYEDRSSMWHSIEARTPFADDNELANHAFRIPASYKIKEGVYKYILREAMRDHLPAEIKDRKDKLGFVTPVDQWSVRLKDRFMDEMNDSLNEYFNVNRIKRDHNKLFAINSHADGVRVFRMLSFAIWKKRFDL